MINKEVKFPFYARAALILIGLYFLIIILFDLKDIIIPIIFAMIIAIVIKPIVDFIVRFKISRVFAIFVAIFIVFLIIATIFLLLFSQISKFSEAWPSLVEKSTDMFSQVITGISSNFDVNPEKIHDWLQKTESDLLKSSNALIGATLLGVGSLLVELILIPVYVFLFLYYKPLLVEFIHRLFGQKHEEKVSEITVQTESVIQHYLIGLLIEAAIIATLNSVGLLILGIDFAIVLGVIGAMVNVIPLIGGVVAVALPMLVALATKSSPIYALYVMAVYYTIQMIDNHYIIPTIVASKVKINALLSIIIILGGNALWGIAGMFLSLPLVAIIKIIFDHIEPLKPWGFLLGNSFEQDKNTDT